MNESMQTPATDSPSILRVAAGEDRFCERRALGISSLDFKVAMQDSSRIAKELTWPLKAAEKAGMCLDHSMINKSANPRIIRVCSANKDSSIKFK